MLEEPTGPTRGECLRVERLVWVGCKGGESYLKRPLPISIVSETCAFRPAILSAMRQSGHEWRTVFDNGNVDATIATVRMDLAVTAWLASLVPLDLDVIAPQAGLPQLPSYAINLYLPRSGASAPVQALVAYLRQAFGGGCAKLPSESHAPL